MLAQKLKKEHTILIRSGNRLDEIVSNDNYLISQV